MTTAYAAAMDPGGKFIMVTPSKIAIILFIIKNEEFRIFERPVRQVIKLMNIEDTTLIQDIREDHESAKLGFSYLKISVPPPPPGEICAKIAD